jgi:hypothetical protein
VGAGRGRFQLWGGFMAFAWLLLQMKDVFDMRPKSRKNKEIGNHGMSVKTQKTKKQFSV